jgi:hypothetical protein
MPNTIRHKRGTTTPLASALVTGELAINTATGTVFTKTDAGAVVSLGGLSLADLGNGNATAGALVLDALENSNAPSATNPFATEGDLNSAVTSFSAQIGVCRAWVNFNGTGTVAIRAALNVTSLTDNGVGDYTVNFTTALADTNYAFFLDGMESSAANSYYGYESWPQTVATGSIRVRFGGNFNGGTLALDTAQYRVAIFR